MQKLTAKQQRFCEEYLIDFNATQSAIRAGYSKKAAHSIGIENLNKPLIKEQIEKKKRELREKTEITIEWIAEQLKENHELAREMGKVSDSSKALELLGKMQGAFTDRVDMTAKVEIKTFDDFYE